MKVKINNTWNDVNTIYKKVNGIWTIQNETDTLNYLHNNVVLYKGELPTIKYVTNQLPEFIINNWEFTHMIGGNYNYSTTNYSGESVKPSGNIMVVFPDGGYSEGYTIPKTEYYPMLIKGHTYYIRWMSRKELITNGSGTVITQDNSGVSEDVYWPLMENAIFRGLNNSNYHLWRKNEAVFTLTASQWPNQNVQDGKYAIRFDCNNNRKYVKYFCLADFMLIDLTECYTNQGYTIPTLSQLNAKRYFYGSIPIDSW